MKRYYVYETDNGSGLDCLEDDNGEWCKADEVIQEQQEMAAELAVAQIRIAELEAKNTFDVSELIEKQKYILSLEGRNKQQELSIVSLCQELRKYQTENAV